VIRYRDHGRNAKLNSEKIVKILKKPKLIVKTIGKYGRKVS
jgi:hypothetical protein